jgi:endo-1,4-beta-mannosidase
VDTRLTPEAHADLARQAGADSQRLTLGWNWAEPYKDDYRLGGFDQIYRASLARGIRPLITIMFSPWWTWAPGTQCERFGPQCTFPPDPVFDSEWREFVALVAQRYPQAIGIEIWNEPNLRLFWKPSPDPARYTDLLGQAYRAVKSVDPDMPVISGGLANASTTQDGTESLVDFLTGIYDNGGKGYMDGIGFHPYGAIPTRTDFVERSADRVRSVRDSHGDVGKPLWATEFGLTTTGNPWPNVWTEQEQAEGLALHYKTLAAMPDVAGIYLHTLLEPEGSRAGDGPGFGVVRGDGTPKPSFCAVAAARAAGPGCGS